MYLKSSLYDYLSLSPSLSHFLKIDFANYEHKLTNNLHIITKLWLYFLEFLGGFFPVSYLFI